MQSVRSLANNRACGAHKILHQQPQALGGVPGPKHTSTQAHSKGTHNTSATQHASTHRPSGNRDVQMTCKVGSTTCHTIQDSRQPLVTARHQQWLVRVMEPVLLDEQRQG